MKTSIIILSVITLCNLKAISQSATASASSTQGELKEGQKPANNHYKHSNNNVADSILGDLFRMRLISTKDDVSFTLTNDKFEVNGTEQQAKVFETFKKKYQIVKDRSISYSKHGGSTSCTVVN